MTLKWHLCVITSQLAAFAQYQTEADEAQGKTALWNKHRLSPYLPLLQPSWRKLFEAKEGTQDIKSHSPISISLTCQESSCDWLGIPDVSQSGKWVLPRSTASTLRCRADRMEGTWRIGYWNMKQDEIPLPGNILLIRQNETETRLGHLLTSPLCQVYHSCIANMLGSFLQECNRPIHQGSQWKVHL